MDFCCALSHFNEVLSLGLIVLLKARFSLFNLVIEHYDWIERVVILKKSLTV